MTDPVTAAVASRQRWTGILARARTEDLESAWRALPTKPAYEFLRRPEAGLVVLRGRAGGSGGQFNLGEATVSRCAVQLPGSASGVGYVLGRDLRHAELAAVFDALLQDEKIGAQLESNVIGPLAAAQAEARQAVARRSADTKVNFFTMVRGMS